MFTNIKRSKRENIYGIMIHLLHQCCGKKIIMYLDLMAPINYRLLFFATTNNGQDVFFVKTQTQVIQISKHSTFSIYFR